VIEAFSNESRAKNIPWEDNAKLLCKPFSVARGLKD